MGEPFSGGILYVREHFMRGTLYFGGEHFLCDGGMQTVWFGGEDIVFVRGQCFEMGGQEDIFLPDIMCILISPISDLIIPYIQVNVPHNPPFYGTVWGAVSICENMIL